MTGDERAVSEVIAFILVFSIVIGSVGLLYWVGFDSMTRYQEDEQLRNAERAMSALGNNFNDVQRSDGIGERTGELSLRGGSINVVEDGTEVTVDVGGTEVADTTLGAIEYEKGSSSIAYEGGGVFRGEPSGDVVLDRPTLICDTDGDRDVAIVSLLVIDSGQRTIKSDEGVEVRAIQENSSTVTATGSDVTVTVANASYENGWRTTFERGGWNWDDSTDSGTCAADHVTVRIVTVTVELSH